MEDKICPFMSKPYNAELNLEVGNVNCKKEKCMAWGTTHYIQSDNKDASGSLIKQPIQGCKLINRS